MTEPSLNFVKHNINNPTNKLILYAVLSVVLMLLDNNYSAVQRGKAMVATLLYPLQRIASQPVYWVQDGLRYIQNQNQLIQQNQQLKQQNQQLKLRIHQQDTKLITLSSLSKMNELREQFIPQAQIAEVVSARLNPMVDYLTINKGKNDHIQLGDPVTDGDGLIGQVISVQPFSAEVNLIFNSDVVIPVMIARTGVRTLLYGHAGTVDLRYLPTDADLRPNDLLITSGMDSIYPEGIPIASVTQAKINNNSPYYQTKLKIIANLYNARFVLVIPQKKT